MKPAVRVLATCCLLAASCASASATGAEPTQQFLDALLAQQYYDEALAYLDQMADSPLADEDFQRGILYQQGLVLLRSARSQREIDMRQRQLDRAEEKLQAFIGQDPTHPQSGEAASQLATIHLERARILTIRAEDQSGSSRESSLQTARQYYDKATDAYEKRLEELREQLESIPAQLDAAADQQTIARRDVLRSQYTEARLSIAVLVYEKAQTYGQDSQEQLELLEDAALKFEDIALDYRRLAAGLYASLWHGRCLKELDRVSDALVDFQELLLLPQTDEVLRRIKIHALHLALECWLDQSQRAYDVAVETGTQFLAGARPEDATSEHWLAVRYLVALASKRLVDTDRSLSGVRKATLLRDARSLAQEVVQVDGEYQQPAQMLLAQLSDAPQNVSQEDGQVGGQPPPQTFAEAKECGDQATHGMQESQQVISTLESVIARTDDPDRGARLREQIAAAEESIVENRRQAAGCYRLATELADGETPLEDLNHVRFLLAYHLYFQEEYYDSAVLGEFVAFHYPHSPGGLKCATLAMASYQVLYMQATQNGTQPTGAELDPEFAARHVLRVADFLANTWPDEPEAQDALITLIRFLVQQGELSRADEYLQKIDPEGDKRGEAELILGRALWSRYKQGLQEIRQVEAGNPLPEQGVPDPLELEETKQMAQATLAAGIERMKEEEVDGTLVDALLALTEIYIDTGQTEKAFPLLEDETYGLLTLLDQDHSATQREHFAAATYRTALRAYIAAVPAQTSAGAREKMMQSASAVMLRLQEAMGDTPEGKRRLVALYFSLASDIKTQLDLVSDSAKKEPLALAFESFLSQIAAASEEKAELTWVADSLKSVGESFDAGLNHDLSPTAERFYRQAVEGFQQLLELGSAGTIELSENEELQIRIRLAGALRGLRRFRQAMDEYETILRQKNQLLSIQVEAAQTYQDWVASGVGLPKLYNVAITGGRRDEDSGRYIVWGWKGIADRTADDVRFREIFYDARYHWALCSLEYALISPNEERAASLQRAHSTILSTDQEFLAPALRLRGSELTARQSDELSYARDARPLFDTLMKRVQRSMGQQDPPGLPPLES